MTDAANEDYEMPAAVTALVLAACGLFGVPIIRCCAALLKKPKDRDYFEDFLASERSKENFKLPTNELKSGDDGSVMLHAQTQPQTQRRVPPRSHTGFQYDFKATNSVDFYLDCLGKKLKQARNKPKVKSEAEQKADTEEDQAHGYFSFCKLRCCCRCVVCHERFRFSVAARSAAHAVFFGFLSILVSWVGYECGGDTFTSGCLEVWNQQMDAIYGIYGIIAPLLIFILAIYVNNRLSWWFEIKAKCWRVQGGLHEYALVLASALPGKDAGEDLAFPLPTADERMDIRYRVYRYLNLIHYFMYYSAHNDPGPLPLAKLLDRKLLEVGEVKLLLDVEETEEQKANTTELSTLQYIGRALFCTQNPFPWSCLVSDGYCKKRYNKNHYCPQKCCVDRCMSQTDRETAVAPDNARPKGKPRCNYYHRMPLLWLSQLTRYMEDEAKILSCNPSVTLYMCIQRIRGDVGSLLHADANKPPYSWMQLLQIYVDVVLLLTPFALYSVAESVSDGAETRIHMQVWNVIGTVLSAVIFQGMLEMVHVMDDTWGTDLDDLNANATLLSTERTLFYYLSERTPKEHDPYGFKHADVDAAVEEEVMQRLKLRSAKFSPVSPKVGAAAAGAASAAQLMSDEIQLGNVITSTVEKKD